MELQLRFKIVISNDGEVLLFYTDPERISK